MSIKQFGGVFGRNPTFNDVTIEGTLTFDGDIDINSDLTVDGEVTADGVNISQLTGATLKIESTGAGLGAGSSIGKIDFFGNDASAPGAGVKASIETLTEASLGDDGALVFRTSSGTANNIETARLRAGVGLVLPSGNGIDFSATAGTGTSELLDDYEEGTSTPVLIGTTAAGTGTYTSQDGKYTKVGNLVTFQMTIIWSAHTGTGTMQIQGLPFTTSATGIGTASVYVSDVASSAGTFIQCFLSGSTTDIRLREVATGGGSAASVAMDTAGQMFISGHYYV